MNQLLRKIAFSMLLAMGISMAFAQGVTTSSMNGKVTDSNGEELPGATVIAVHVPSGTQYGNVTDLQGFFRIPNMRVGGPYKVTITFVGFEPFEKSGIQLKLGQKLYVAAELSQTATELEEIVVTAAGDIFDGNKTGAGTALSVENINAAPTVGRSLGDFARFNPQTLINEGDDGLEISIGGLNNRYNAIYIDGAVNNDVFGLAASGTNGGQTGVSPISVDAIEQLTVSVAPFDVRQSGFAGGSINAVTRSGTNDIEGSAYYFFRNQDLAGKTPFEDANESTVNRQKLAEFSAETYGFRVGGPIVKDKAFFFVNVELQRDETPQPFDFTNYRGSATRGAIDTLVNFLDTAYNYNPGSYLNNTAFLESDKVIAKFDVNLNKNHKLTLRHSYTKAENLEARRSTATGLEFINGSEFFVSETHSSAIELKSLLGNNMSNHFTIGATIVRDDRDPQGDPFPSVFIDDGEGGITFGSEPFSTANLLDQDIITINNNLEIYKGRHTILVGANAEFYSVKNLFIPFNFGDYTYEFTRGVGSVGPSFLDDFLNRRPASLYQFSYGLNSAQNGDETTGTAAEFNSSQFGLYVQDEVQVNDKLKLTVGVRADINFFEDTPANPFFNDPSTLRQFPYNLQGAKTGEFIDPQVSWSPRIGFNYDVRGDRTFQLRGGVGIFTSRIPLVWPGSAYNNNGLNTGFDFERIDFTTPPSLVPDVNNQPRNIAVGEQEPSGNVDLFVDDFRIPQVLKVNLAGDKALPGDMVLTVEGIYTKFLNNVYYQNINVDRPTGGATGTPDNRLINFNDRVDGTYGRILLGSNTSKGYTYNLSASLSKRFDYGLNAQLSYSFGDAWTIYDGTSSQNSSQWRGLHAVNGRNNWLQIQRSDFAQGHRILANLTYRKDYAGFAATQVSLVYEGQSGNPYSYVYGLGDDITGEDSRNRELVYVPRNADEIVLVDRFDDDDNLISTAAEQWEALNAFIEEDDYLKERRGRYAQRNQSRTPFESIIDLRVLQDFYLEMGNGKKNTLQFSLDIFNLPNLLNKAWGKRYDRQFAGYELLQFAGFQEGSDTPTFTFNGFDENEAFFGDFDDAGVLSSRWQIQLGVRYIFGN
ncbi:TonB-dependent receptor [Fulvivirga sp. M361]|uniref:TonB-dependent receptor n=1 Tax=Fulvivirga sp. M361 TaxID=2594266 RepID=UPI00117A3E50|nr:carboxypeptidase regulatory-like domain-containing protein [Fulvivirga sp. M361]TRX50419.1 TonB-dependent receptor [Fulvivirga sp. M361]